MIIVLSSLINIFIFNKIFTLCWLVTHWLVNTVLIAKSDIIWKKNKITFKLWWEKHYLRNVFRFISRISDITSSDHFKIFQKQIYVQSCVYEVIKKLKQRIQRMISSQGVSLAIYISIRAIRCLAVLFLLLFAQISDTRKL